MYILDGLAFDDVLLVPKFSDLSSRLEVDLTVECKGFKFSNPVVPSNMKTICELEMAKLCYNNKSMAILHRFIDFEQQLEWLKEIKTWGEDSLKFVGFSVGVKPEEYKKVDELCEAGVQIICIDIAHGFSKHCIEMTKYISNKYPHVLLISGNVATSKGAIALWDAGADIVKAGIGAGSICATRTNTGNGVPSITTLADCRDSKIYYEKRTGRKVYLMNDGGCHSSGCVAKSLCFADFTMCGNLFSACSETPGDIIDKGPMGRFKSYVGSSTHRGIHKEGVEALQHVKGSANEVFRELSEGIKSCCSYQGVRNLQDLKKEPAFIKMSAAGLKESGSHHLSMIIK